MTGILSGKVKETLSPPAEMNQKNSKFTASKFNGLPTRTVRIPERFTQHCNDMAMHLSSGLIFEGVLRDVTGQIVFEVQYQQEGFEVVLREGATTIAPEAVTAVSEAVTPTPVESVTAVPPVEAVTAAPEAVTPTPVEAVAPVPEAVTAAPEAVTATPVEAVAPVPESVTAAPEAVTPTPVEAVAVDPIEAESQEKPQEREWAIAAVTASYEVVTASSDAVSKGTVAPSLRERLLAASQSPLTASLVTQSRIPVRPAPSPVLLPTPVTVVPPEEKVEAVIAPVTTEETALQRNNPLPSLKPTHFSPDEESKIQTFGKRLFRAWRSLALAQVKGDETPWNAYVPLEAVYRHEFSAMQGTQFLRYLSSVQGREISFGGVLLFNETPDPNEGIEIKGKYVSELTFALVTGASISVTSEDVTGKQANTEEDPVTARLNQLSSDVTTSGSQRNRGVLKLQQLCHKLIPGSSAVGLSLFM